MSNAQIKPYCFVDFDGTLVDNKKRMYQFCCDYCCESFSSMMSMDEYWMLKRFGINELDVINRILDAKIDKSEYQEAKLTHMEEERYLALDELIPGTTTALSMLSELYNLVLVTRREYPDRLYREVDRLDIGYYFKSIVVIPHGNETKADAIQKRFELTPGALMIGDTEDDISAGLALDIISIFVLSGIRSALYPMRYSEASSISVYKSLIDFAQEASSSKNAN